MGPKQVTKAIQSFSSTIFITLYITISPRWERFLQMEDSTVQLHRVVPKVGACTFSSCHTDCQYLPSGVQASLSLLFLADILVQVSWRRHPHVSTLKKWHPDGSPGRPAHSAMPYAWLWPLAAMTVWERECRRLGVKRLGDMRHSAAASPEQQGQLWESLAQGSRWLCSGQLSSQKPQLKHQACPTILVLRTGSRGNAVF